MRFVRHTARLLAALAACALAGCPAPAPVSGPTPETAPPAAARAVASRSEAAPCPTLPPGLEQGVVGGPWAAFESWVKAHAEFGFEFTDTTTLPLCADCPSVRTRIVSEVQTPCVTDPLSDQPLLLGMLEVVDPAARWNKDVPDAGDTLFLFASDSVDVVAVFRDGAVAARLRPYTWNFYYCGHAQPPATPVARAEWRDRNTAMMKRAPGDEDVESGGTLSYGWMACASGCCQFYGPPSSEVRFQIPAYDPRPERGRDYFLRIGGDCDALGGGHASPAAPAPGGR